MSSPVPYDISRLECFELKRLLDETNVYAQGLRIEKVPLAKGRMNPDRHPADVVGLNVHTPAIRFVDSSDELAHFLVAYRFGLRLSRRAFRKL